MVRHKTQTFIQYDKLGHFIHNNKNKTSYHFLIEVPVKSVGPYLDPNLVFEQTEV